MAAPSIGGGNVNTAAEEVSFADYIAKQTGLDPRVVLSWAQLETGGTPIGHNWLNLRPYPGDPYSGTSSGGFEEFSSLANAEAATITRIRQPFAAPILASKGQSPATEIAAIAGTGWDAGHYGGAGGPKLLAEFTSIYGAGAAGSYSGSPAGNVGGNPSASGVASGVTGAITGAFSGVVGPIWSWFTSHLLRLGLLIAGGALIIVGVMLLGRESGALPNVTPVPV